MCGHYGSVLSTTHRHFIDSVEHDNCVLCLVDDVGPLTQEQVGQYLGVTKEWVSQIEKRALNKLKAQLAIQLEDLINDDNFNISTLNNSIFDKLYFSKPVKRRIRYAK